MCMSTAARRIVPNAAPEWELARGVREPVADGLLRRKPAFLEPRPNRVGRFTAIFKIVGGEFCGRSALSSHDGVDFMPKAGTGFKQIFNLCSCVADSHTPSGTWIDGGGRFEFEEMPQDPPDLRIELGPLRGSQALYLLREVFPVEGRFKSLAQRSAAACSSVQSRKS